MFKDRYENEIENISADGYIKQKVLKQIKSQYKERTVKTGFFRGCIAVCCVVILCVSAFALNTFIKPDINNITYDNVYNAINSLNKSNISDEEAVVELYSDDVKDSGINYTAKGTATSEISSEQELSETNEQVKGVDEADIVKTDGEYIYVFSTKNKSISIVKSGKEAKKVSEIELGDISYYNNEMFLKDSKLILLSMEPIENSAYNKTEGYMQDKMYVLDRNCYTLITIYDVKNPQNPQKLYECKQSGEYNTSRLIDNRLYVISNHFVNSYAIKKDDYATYVPSVVTEDMNGPVKPESICIGETLTTPIYTVICGYDINSGNLIGTQSVLGDTYTVYCSKENIITASYSNGETMIVRRFSLGEKNIEFKAETEINGTLLNQFSIDEYDGYFRFVTTENKGIEKKDGNVVTYAFSSLNSLIILDGNLKEIGKIENIAPNERVYSVRFMGDIAYFVTFRQVDPLFSVDLSNSKEPKIIGALKIPGFSNFLFPFGEGKLLGIGQDADEKTGKTGGIKLSLFDISDPANVTESAKTVLKYRNSDSLYNHKASLVDAKRGLVGIPTWWEEKMQYNLYKYNEKTFETVAEFVIEDYSDFIRGIYINEEFYVITDSQVSVYDINNFNIITTVKI